MHRQSKITVELARRRVVPSVTWVEIDLSGYEWPAETLAELALRAHIPVELVGKFQLELLNAAGAKVASASAEACGTEEPVMIRIGRWPESGLTEAELANLIEHAPVRLRPWLVEFTRPGTTADIARRRGVTECTVRWWRMDCEHWILTGEKKKGDPPTNAGPHSVT